MLNRLWQALVGLAVLALGIFAVTRVKHARSASVKAESKALLLEANTEKVERSVEKAQVARKVAKAHAAKAEAIKAKTVDALKTQESKRGSATARSIADQLNRL